MAFYFLNNRHLLFSVLLFISVIASSGQTPDWSKYTDPKTRLSAIIEYGSKCIREQRFDEAIRIFTTGVAIAKQSSLDSLAARNLLYLGIAYRYKSLFDSSFYYLQQAQKIADQKKIITLQASVHLEYFGIYNRLGKTDSATENMRYLVSILPRLDSNGTECAKIEMYLGHTSKHLANYNQSLKHYYKALSIFSILRDSMNIAQTYSSIANVLDLWQQDKGLAYHWEAIHMLTQLGRKSELTNEYLDITDSYYSLNKLDSAEMTVQIALSLANELHEKTYQTYAYLHLGHIYKLRGQFAKAENYFKRSIQSGEEMDLENDLAECYQGLAETYMADEQPAKAKILLDKYLFLVKNDNNKEEILEAYADLKENEYNLHNYAKAHEYEKLYETYKDSAYTESVSRNAAEMDSKYQSEKKEQEIALLKKDQDLKNTALQKERAIKLSAFMLAGLLAVIGILSVNRYRVIQKVRRMVEIEKLRNNIARDLHDDLGSTLSSININSKIALSHSGEENLVRGQLEKIREHSGKMMEGMSDIVWAIHPGNDSMEKMIVRMKEFAVEILEPLNIHFTFNGLTDNTQPTLNVARRKEVYLIFKEAINNAAKYSYCTEIIVDLVKNKNGIYLGIRDNGRGFDKTRLKSGNGLRNMEQRAHAIGASLVINSTPGKGTMVRLDIPLT